MYMLHSSGGRYLDNDFWQFMIQNLKKKCVDFGVEVPWCKQQSYNCREPWMIKLNVIIGETPEGNRQILDHHN